MNNKVELTKAYDYMSDVFIKIFGINYYNFFDSLALTEVDKKNFKIFDNQINAFGETMIALGKLIYKMR